MEKNGKYVAIACGIVLLLVFVSIFIFAACS